VTNACDKIKDKSRKSIHLEIKIPTSIFFDELTGKSTFLEFREGSQRPAEAAGAAGGL